MVEIENKVNRIPELVSQSKSISGSRVTAGVHSEAGSEEGEIKLSDLALIHEFGTTITPNDADALRVPFGTDEDGSQNYIFLQKVEIPARSFLRTGFSDFEKRIEDVMDGLVKNLLLGNLSRSRLLKLIGQEMKQAIIDNFGEHGPGLSDITIANRRKGSSQPLQDDGQLFQAITFQIDN